MKELSAINEYYFDDLMMCGYGDRTRTQVGVNLIREKYPISQGTFSKIEKRFHVFGHVKCLSLSNDDYKLFKTNQLYGILQTQELYIPVMYNCMQELNIQRTPKINVWVFILENRIFGTKLFDCNLTRPIWIFHRQRFNRIVNHRILEFL